MASYTDITTQAGDQILEVLKRVEDASVDAVSTISNAAGGVLAKLPTVPISSKLPSPVEVAQANYSLAERIYAEQKNFTLRLLDSAAPVVPAQPSAPSTSSKATSSKATSSK